MIMKYFRAGIKALTKVFCVRRFKTEEEAITIANSATTGLAGNYCNKFKMTGNVLSLQMETTFLTVEHEQSTTFHCCFDFSMQGSCFHVVLLIKV